MNRELKALTGVRGVAATMVMFYHFFENDSYFGSFEPWLLRHGYLGVDLFFILSGFVMSLSYAKTFQTAISFADIRLFLIKRFARIYPLYIVITMLFVLKQSYNFSGAAHAPFGVGDFVACVLMIQAWGVGVASPAGASWSLSTEVFAYLVFPFVAHCVVFRRGHFAWALAGICGAAILMVAMSGQGVSGQLDVVQPDSILPLVRSLAGFGLGMVAYWCVRQDIARRLLGASFVLVGLIAAFVLASVERAPDLAMFVLLPLLVCTLYFESAAARAVFANKVSYHLGLVSYSMYLVHPLFVPIKIRLQAMLEPDLGGSSHGIALLFVVVMSWGLSVGLYTFIEKPGRSLCQAALLRRKVPTTMHGEPMARHP